MFTSQQRDRFVSMSLAVKKANEHQEVSHVQAVAGWVETGVNSLCLLFQQCLHLLSKKLTRKDNEILSEITKL